jgi:hypothetical protein
MKSENYPGVRPVNIVFYHKTKDNKHGIHVQLKMLEEPATLIYAYGKYEEQYFEWNWVSQEIELEEDDLIFRDAPIDLEIGEIKGHILINKNGSIIDINFNPTILAVGVRLEEADKEDVKLVLKKKLKLIEKLPKVVKPPEFYKFGDSSIEVRIKNFLLEKSKVNKSIKIMDPYLSTELIKLLKSAMPGDLQIEILTCQLGYKTVLSDLIKELGTFPSGISIIIKTLIEESETVNIKKGPTPNPFHDRFIITEADFLGIGTSFNTITKNSIFIYEMTNYYELEDIFDEWFSGKIISYESNKVKYNLKFEQWYP